MLPVPERGRGPGQSALQDTGLPDARGHPGAAQPVGEEDRAAQSGGGGRPGPPWAQREGGVEPAPHRAAELLSEVSERGCGSPSGGPSRGTCLPWLPEPSGVALRPTTGRPTSWSQLRGRVMGAGSHLAGPFGWGAQETRSVEGQPDTRPHLCSEAVMGSRRGGASWGPRTWQKLGVQGRAHYTLPETLLAQFWPVWAGQRAGCREADRSDRCGKGPGLPCPAWCHRAGSPGH